MKSIRFDLTEKLDAVMLAAEEAGLAAHPAALAASFLRDYFRTFQPTDTHASRSLVARKLRDLSEPEGFALRLEARGLLPIGHTADTRRAVLLLLDDEIEEKLFSAIEPFHDTAMQYLWNNRFAETLDRMFSTWNDGRWLACDAVVKLYVLTDLDNHLNHGFGPHEWNAPSVDAAALIALLPEGETGAEKLRGALLALINEVQLEHKEAVSSGPIESIYKLSPSSIRQLLTLSRLSSDEMDRLRPLEQRVLQAVESLDLDEVQKIDSYLSLSIQWRTWLPETKFYQLRFVAAHLQKHGLRSIKAGAELEEAVRHCLDYLSSLLGKFSPIPANH